ncbi:cysteine hydrolase [Thalassospira sp. MA62]|nr:cysteine hydrolase [Thalassospira sp. MA62]
MTAQTILDMSDANLAIGSPKNAALIVIDAQEEYRDGKLKLFNLPAALDNVATLIAHWRDRGGTIIHIQHHATGVFDPSTRFAKIMPEVTPKDGETVVTKNVPSAFGGTNLEDILIKGGFKQVVLSGFMTHVCVSTTARAANEKGYGVSIAHDAVTTRDLPDPLGGPDIPAATLHQNELAILADAFARIVATDAVVHQ